jgi:hypothetical protein
MAEIEQQQTLNGAKAKSEGDQQSHTDNTGQTRQGAECNPPHHADDDEQKCHRVAQHVLRGGQKTVNHEISPRSRPPAGHCAVQ